MSRCPLHRSPLWPLLPVGLLGAGPGMLLAQSLNLAQAPLFLTNNVKANIMVVYDNSQSMDATMAGKVIAGDDPNTRGNIARRVLRNTITTYRSAFQWGVASFGLQSAPSKQVTYAYYFGTDAEVRFTDDCTNGLTSTNLPCIANPDTSVVKQNYISYGPAKTGDDPSINDVLYLGSDAGPALWGVGAGPTPTHYRVYTQRTGTDPASWTLGDFAGGLGNWNFTPTDAGYLPTSPPDGRMVWVRRAWGYLNDVTGGGVINRAAAADSSAQYNALMTLLAPETGNANGPEIKNAALYTPLAGTLDTVKSYLTGGSTPITQSCQKNFVLLTTDGNPTATKTGGMYSLADQKNTLSGANWTFSTAANEVFNSISALRRFSVNGNNYDAKTYVVGLGDSVANASSIAALNEMANQGGTNTAYLASDEVALAESFRKISNDIVAQTASASAVALNGANLTTGTRTFQARFNSADWSGQLLAYAVDTAGTLTPDSQWTDPGQDLNKKDWDTGRQILSFNKSSGKGIAFRWPANALSPAATELGTEMVDALNTGPLGNNDGQGALRLSYLRGDRSHESQNCSGACAPVFRNRSSVLGDIINSTPFYVGGGTASYRERIEAKSYSEFAGKRASLTPLVFVGANDGMLHGFNANSGEEVFAYVPAAVANRLSALTDPAYNHRYSVDGTPTVGDVFDGGNWHTLLVSGMNAGAKGLFALDVTDPALLKESSADQVARWEIDGSDADVGYIFGRPTLTKLKSGQWMAIVGNGYNSTNGHSVLLLVDVATGKIIKRIDAGNGGGLSEAVAISSAYDGVTDIVYAGDLAGNLWKFDLSSTDSNQWAVAYQGQPLFTTAAGQAITARPAVTPGAPGSFIVSFGTGRYVDVSDTSTSSKQALYGILDNGVATGKPVKDADLQEQSVVSTVSSGGKTYRLTTHAVGLAGDAALPGDNVISRAGYASLKSGWRLDLPVAGERVVTAATVRNGRVLVSTLVPNNAVCSTGGDGWTLEVAATTGNRWSDGTLDVNADGTIDASDRIGGSVVSGTHSSSIPTRTVLVGKGTCGDIGITNTSAAGAGTPVTECHKGSTRTSHRGAWEQIR
jgi:type IV pilus assembly protein PilY1